MSRAIIYLRVSTEEQAEKGFSIQAQREECMKKAQELGCDDITEYLDEGVSGSILERPMLINALDAMKCNKIDYFISFDSSRLSRNVSHQLILIDSIKKYGARLIFVRTNYDDTAEGRFQITIMSAVDEYERARLKIRTELGKRTKAKQKQLTHNPGLYGYTFNKDTDLLIINENQAQILRMMYNWLLEDKIGPSEIAKKLNDLGIPSMRGKQWSRVSINRMLNNFSYTGTLFIRRYDTRDYKLNKFKKKGEKVSIREKPKEQWIPIEIPAIIDLNTWQKAKLQLNKAKRAYKKSKKEIYLLSGLLRCQNCGGTIFGKSTYKNGITQNKYYCCINKYNYTKSKEDRCTSKLYKAEDIENCIWNTIKPWILNKNRINEIMKKKLSYNKMHKNKKAIKQLIQQAESEKQNIIKLFQKNIINENQLDERLALTSRIIKNLKMEYEKAMELKNNKIEMEVEEIIERINLYLENIDTLQKNKLLHYIIEEIIISNNSIKIRTLIPKSL